MALKTVDGVIAKFTKESVSDRILTRGQSNLTKSRIVAVRSFYDQPLRRYKPEIYPVMVVRHLGFSHSENFCGR